MYVESFAEILDLLCSSICLHTPTCLLASCIIYAWALIEYVIFILFLIICVHSLFFSVKFTVDKVPIFVILPEKC